MKRRIAYTAVVRHPGFGIGVAEENDSGYWPLASEGRFATWEEASQRARTLNQEKLKLTEEDAALIVASSMRAQNERK